MDDDDVIHELQAKWRERLWKAYGSRNAFGEIKGFEAPMTFDDFVARLDELPAVDGAVKSRCRG